VCFLPLKNGVNLTPISDCGLIPNYKGIRGTFVLRILFVLCAGAMLINRLDWL